MKVVCDRKSEVCTVRKKVRRLSKTGRSSFIGRIIKAHNASTHRTLSVQSSEDCVSVNNLYWHRRRQTANIFFPRRTIYRWRMTCSKENPRNLHSCWKIYVLPFNFESLPDRLKRKRFVGVYEQTLHPRGWRTNRFEKYFCKLDFLTLINEYLRYSI